MSFNLRELERKSLEFQTLTEEQKDSRRKFLSAGLSILLEGSERRATAKQAGIAAGKILEFYLTGNIDNTNFPSEMLLKPKKK
jgi:hypothetical protein